VLKTTRASFLQELAEKGEQQQQLLQRLTEQRRLLEADRQKWKLELEDEKHRINDLEEQLEESQREREYYKTLYVELRRIKDQQILVEGDSEKVPAAIINAFRGRLVSQGLDSLFGTVRFLGDGYYGAFFKTSMMDPPLIRQTYLTNRDASVWYDKTSVELYFRDRYGARAEFDTFDMSLLDEMIMWTLTRLEGNGKGLYVIRGLDDIQGIDKSKVQPAILSLNMEIVKREWHPDGTDAVEREIVFYCYYKLGGALIRNRILFDDNGRIKDLESTLLAFDLGDYFYAL